VRAAGALLPLLLAGCLTAQGGAEGFRSRIEPGMSQDQVRRALGKPKDVVPIPGQGDAPELPVEQWRYSWTYHPGKVVTAIVTLGLSAIFTDWAPYGFDVGFGRDGRVRVVSDVAPRR
jgi:hypothetical protein